jgi:hypothetical protein
MAVTISTESTRGEVGAPSPLIPCGDTVAAVQALEEFYSLARSHPLLSQISFKTRKPAWKTAANAGPEHLNSAFEIYQDAMQVLARAVEENAKLPHAQRMHPRTLDRAAVQSYRYKCNPSRASYRRFIALHSVRARQGCRVRKTSAPRRENRDQPPRSHPLSASRSTHTHTARNVAAATTPRSQTPRQSSVLPQRHAPWHRGRCPEARRQRIARPWTRLFVVAIEIARAG